jgi:DNA-binding transcriptional MerR regulator
MELTTKKIEKSSGLSRETLRTYVRLGWLSKPQFRSFGRYGGSNFWPETTIKQLLTIKSLKKSGYKNKEIDQLLKGT